MLRLKGSEDKVVAVRQFVKMFCICVFEDVTQRDLDLLCEVIYAKGDITKAKKNYILNYKVSSTNYGQVVYRLGKKGILIPKQRSTGKILHPAFEKLIDFIDNPKRYAKHIMVEWRVQ